MTATEGLRRLLDERGVDWIGTSFSTPAKGHPTNTSLGEDHHEATFIEYDDGNVLRLFDLTPAQAVEAALGSGTCRMGIERTFERIDGDEEYLLECSECGSIRWWFAHMMPRYCPDCGRKVVDE